MLHEDAILAVPVSAHDHVQGNAHAVVTLVEYGDFQCPACGGAYPLVKQIQHRYAGNLRFVFRHFPLSQAHPYDQLAAELAEAAAVEGQFWAMHDWLYENQAAWAPRGAAGLEGMRALGLDEAAIAATLRNPDIDAHIRRDHGWRAQRRQRHTRFLRQRLPVPRRLRLAGAQYWSGDRPTGLSGSRAFSRTAWTALMVWRRMAPSTFATTQSLRRANSALQLHSLYSGWFS